MVSALRLAAAFELEIVACPTPLHAKILVAWLGEQIPELQPICPITISRGDPNREIGIAEITRHILAPLGDRRASGPVFLDLSVAQVDEVAWRWLFQRLNERRNELAAVLHAPLVLLVPRWLDPVLPAEAPDLWSIRSVALSLPASPGDSLPHGVGLAAWALPEDLEELRRQVADRRRVAVGGTIADRRAHAAVARRYADALLARDDVARARPLIEDELVELSATIDDVIEHARALRTLAALRDLEGDFAAAQEILTARVLPVVSADAGERAATWMLLASVLEHARHFDEAERILRQEVLPFAEQRGPVWQLEARLQLALMRDEQGEWPDAARAAREELLPVVARIDDAQLRAVGTMIVAELLGSHGESDEAQRLLREDAAPRFQQLNDTRGLAMVKLLLAKMALERGDYAVVVAMVHEDCLPEFERSGEAGLRSLAVVVMAAALARQGAVDDALRALRDPHADAEVSAAADFHLELLARLLIARGRTEDLDEAERHLRRAALLPQPMSEPMPEDLRAWLADRERGRGRLPQHWRAEARDDA